MSCARHYTRSLGTSQSFPWAPCPRETHMEVSSDLRSHEVGSQCSDRSYKLPPFVNCLSGRDEIFRARLYSFAVADVSSAFANLPLHPSLWPHFMFRFFAAPSDDVDTLFMHLHGDYGHALCQEHHGIYFSRKLWCRWRKR